MRTVYTHLTLIISGIGLLAGCSQERPPRTTSEFLDSPIMLEAAMVRCSQDRVKTRYDAECINAREAVKQIEAKEEAARKVEAEALSEIKRQALRRAQEAAAQARRRAADNERLREEAEYLAQFGVVPPQVDQSAINEAIIDNSPQAVIPTSDEQPVLLTGPGDVLPATDGGNAPVSAAEPMQEASGTDLKSVREELQRRNEEGGS